MRNKDWSLVLFTTLAQLSVGIILWFTLLGHFHDHMSLFVGGGLSLKNPVLLALVFIGVATTSSFLHLGRPSNAPNALKNLPGSWLSREILAINVYLACLLITFVLGWRPGGSGYLEYALLLCSVAGLALLWMMIRVYVMPTIPAWNSWYTSLSFVSATICLGLLTVMAYHYLGVVTFDEQLSDKLTIVLALILFVEIASGFFHQSQLEKMDTGIDELVFSQGAFHRVFLSRMALLVITFLALLVAILKPGLLPAGSYFICLVLIFVQELMGRLLFYSSYFRVGV